LLATTGFARGRETPNLPTVAELGMPGFAAYTWTSVMVPSGVPAEVVATLRRGLRQVVRQPEFREAIERMGFDAVDEDAERLAKQIKSERERYRPIIRRLGIGGGLPGTAEPKSPPGH
jgi:tripartite-type tricarboxylate transporter receptor subunit TctC